MSGELMHFPYAGEDVRIVVVDGEPRFVLADLCRVLDIANPRDTAGRVTPESVGTTDVLDARGVSHPTNVVDEPGLYEVVFLSRKPEAREFRRWITVDVLPALRRTGSYTVPAPVSREQQLAQAVVVAQQVIDEQAARVRELEPKADYVDRFVADEDLRLLRNVAKSLGINEHELRHALLEHHWIYQEVQERWSNRRGEKVRDYRYSPYADKTSYFRPVPAHDAPRFRGEVMHTLKVTPAGAQAIARAAHEWGLTSHQEA